MSDTLFGSIICRLNNMREFKESKKFVFMCDNAFSESFGLFMYERFSTEFLKFFQDFFFVCN